MALGALAALAACAMTTTSTDCSEQPEPTCVACAGSPAILAVCQDGAWICAAAGPCPVPGEDASPPPEAGIVEAGSDASTYPDEAGDSAGDD
jgi:hypothetical protein